MKKQTGKSTSGRSNKSIQTPPLSRSSSAKKGQSSVIPEVLLGTTGIAIVSAAAVGVLGFFAWKNREKILSFVGNYIDLPESWQSEDESANDDFADDSSVGTLASHTSTYTAPTTEQRM